MTLSFRSPKTFRNVSDIVLFLLILTAMIFTYHLPMSIFLRNFNMVKKPSDKTM